MNVTDYTFLLNKPDAINNRQTLTLEKIVEEFPYFQSARALRLKGLYNEDSFKYNHALKVTAAYTTDRSVLFDFITSDTFTAIQKGLYDQKLEQLHQIVVSGAEIVIEAPRLMEQEQENVAQTNYADSSPVAEETPAQKLELGRPLDFSKEEKHSFQEWLQLSQINPIQRDPVAEDIIEQEQPELELERDPKQKKIELIDKFIEANPKIPPIRQDKVTSILVEPSKPDNTYLMTETLARVYLEQKKYQKAIQAYEILILKYPEKSSFFADRILDIRNLQQNNKE
ncbi:MAG TPA: tetratricopeptide repeat protein [Flavobacterium sp.]